MAIRRQVFAEEPGCAYCGRAGQADDVVDHIRNLAAAGTDDRSNLRRSCRACSARKTAQESVRGRG